VLSVLCEPAAREVMLDTLFRGCTTFGVRETIVRRTKLARRFETVKTPYGEIRIKVGSWRGEDITRAPELEDCRRLAVEAGVSVRAVYEAATHSSH
jgi:pyridinium-3,5-bisthiocarboxylic acid mononucleotide nickel chelatase